MATFDSIKKIIDFKINANGMRTITGLTLNDVLKGMLDAVDVALDDEVRKILGNVPVEFDTLKEIADYIVTDKKQYAELTQSIATKLDKSVHESYAETLSNEIAELNKRVAALEGNKTSNLVGSAKVGYALVG